ncbi:hypothetical protein H0X06_03215 [Candidatus Dependentiae bacterium]|nr:hypothetical protein [Candidatus Dependentiae bacterium]
MKLNKKVEQKKMKSPFGREHENAKHLSDNAKHLSVKHPRGTFFGNHRWFPYNINE